MNAAMERKLDAQAQQMAFEMGFAPDPAKAREDSMAAHPARRTPVGPMASQAQFDFIKKLIGERELDADLQSYVQSARELAMGGYLLRASASKLIDALKEAPYASRTQSAPTRELEDGIYVDKDDEGQDHIFKVYVAVHGSGQLCVKRLVVTVDGGRFEYVGLAAKHLPRSARKMTLDEAKAFGAIYGFCVRCGRTLTDEASIAAGIGPICADQM